MDYEDDKNPRDVEAIVVDKNEAVGASNDVVDKDGAGLVWTAVDASKTGAVFNMVDLTEVNITLLWCIYVYY